MRDGAQLIDQVYEASVMTERWPDLLQSIADRIGAKGAAIMTRSPLLTSSITSPAILDDLNDFVEQGWGNDGEQVAPLVAEQWPGFRTEADYRSLDQIAAMPVHLEFFSPRGYVAAASTIIQGTRDNLIHVSFEGFPSHEAARAAIPILDRLRPHLARAISLTALRTDRSQVIVDSLAIGGAAAAVVNGAGLLRAVNDQFARRMGARMIEDVRGCRFSDRRLAAQIANALAQHRTSSGAQSIAMPGTEDEPPFAIHILPIIGAAREMCDSDGVLLLIADATNVSVPSADLLRLLFDLTPTESRIARHLLEGGTVTSATTKFGIGDGTARSHLKSIFAKTGVHRQSELVRLLAAFGAPIINVAK